MAKKKYKLEPVVGLRERAKNEAVRLASERRRELELEREELEKRQVALVEIRDRIKATRKELSQKLSAGTPASAILKHKDFIEGLLKEESDSITRIDEQKEAVAMAEKYYEDAMALLAEASKELSAIEKHKENWAFDERKRENKKEQKLLEEIGSILHERSKKL